MIVEDTRWAPLGLHEEVVRLIKERGWSDLTEIQYRAIPEILAGKNVLIIAPTGMGKTEAALLPVLSMMLEVGAEPVSLLYITPMKALINDLYERIRWWAEKLGFRVARKHGDVGQRERSRRLRRVPHILITTPESLEIDLDWSPRFRKHYANLRWVIVDELHEFLGSKRGAQLALQLERLKHLTGRDVQRIGLSATIGDPEEALRFLSGSSAREMSIVRSELRRKAILSVRHIDDSNDFWEELGQAIVDEIEEPSLIFVNSRYMAEKLKHTLEELGVTRVYVHHSSVSPTAREEAEQKLRRGELAAIVATKTLELGIDIGEISKVVQVRSPGAVSTLIQRVGRSGHRLGIPPKGTIIAVGDLDTIESVAIASLAYEGFQEPVTIRRIPLDVIARTLQGMMLKQKEVDEEEAYKVLSSHPFSQLSRERFSELLDYLEREGLIRRVGRKLRLTSKFYNIWQFRSGPGKRWWSKSFVEFFSLISDREHFTVKHGEKTIGTIDSVYVYRYLRKGDVIRLAGKAWVVKRIDPSQGRVDVEPSEEPGEIPLWRGESARRHRRVAQRVLELLTRGERGIAPGLILGEDTLNVIRNASSEFLSALDGAGLGEGLENIVIYEVHGDEHILIGPFGSRLSETLALILLHVLVKEQGMATYYRTSFLGLSIYNKNNVNIISVLKGMGEEELREIVLASIERSPLLNQIVREIQFSLGRISGVKDLDDSDLLVSEAKRQILESYLDVEGAIELVRGLREGRVRVLRPARLTPLAKYILEMPPIKPWLPDLAGQIAKALEGYALTAIDVANVLDLPDRTVEAKLKDMRKSLYDDRRVTCFIAVEDGECRWVLIKDLDEIVLMEEFRESFTPVFREEAFRVVIRTASGRKKEVIVSPKLVAESWERIAKDIPEEIVQVKISPAAYWQSRETTITYYHVPREALKHLIMNAASVLQRKRLRLCC